MTETANMSLPRIHSVGDLWVQSGYTLGPRTIPDFELVYFPEGTNTKYTVGVDSFVLQEPCIILTKPEEEHSYQFDTDKNVHHLFVHFEFKDLRSEEPSYHNLLQGCSVYPINHIPFVSRIMNKLIWTANHQPLQWNRRLSVLTLAILEELDFSGDYSSDMSQSLPVPVQKAIDYMAIRYAETISIEEIASHSGWTHEHFTRIFTASVGLTPKRFLLEMRLRRAEDRMLKGEGTIKQIAYQVGFKDEHHFSKIYKKIRGITASEYINRCNSPLYRHMAEPLGVTPNAYYSANRLVVVHDPYIK